MNTTKKNILVTGGAGFIGSNLVEALLGDERVGRVRVLDNLSNGSRANIEEFLDNPNFEFIEGDIREYSTCLSCCEGMDLVTHQAARGSVPRSIKDPITTNNVNITGTLNMFYAVKEAGIKRIVFAASSSTYGDSVELPKVEENIGKPLSPYAVTKLVNELYADVFAKTYEGFEYIGLRYFNIFGPKQDPHGAYAAVIPLFMQAALMGKAPRINGDGTYSRDFTFVQNAVGANLDALFIEDISAVNDIYNIACGDRTTLTELWCFIAEAANVSINPIYGETRIGDIPHSLADINKAKSKLGYNPKFSVREGLKLTYEWFTK